MAQQQTIKPPETGTVKICSSNGKSVLLTADECIDPEFLGDIFGMKSSNIIALQLENELVLRLNPPNPNMSKLIDGQICKIVIKNKQNEDEQKDDRLSLNGVYAIHGYYNNNDEKYFSYETATGWSRQIYGNKTDSKFELIQFDKGKRLYYIQNKFADDGKDKWLSCGPRDNFVGECVGLWSNINDRSLWEFIPQNDGYKIKCHHNNICKGWLSYQNNGKWNKLYNNERDACLYKLENIENIQ